MDLQALDESVYRHLTVVISTQPRHLYIPASVFWPLWKAIGPNECVPRALLVQSQQHNSTSSNSLQLSLLAHSRNWGLCIPCLLYWRHPYFLSTSTDVTTLLWSYFLPFIVKNNFDFRENTMNFTVKNCKTYFQ